MSDPTPAPAEQNTDPAPGAPAPASGEGSSTPAKDTDNATAAELRILRKQLKDANQRLSAADIAAAEKAKAEMSELDRYKAEAEQYKAQVEQTNLRFIETQKHNAFRLAAQAAGAVDVAAALKLADLSGIDIDGDTVTGIDSAIKALKKSSPYLFGTAHAPAGSGGGNPSNGAPSITTADIAKMTKTELAAFEVKLARGQTL